MRDRQPEFECHQHAHRHPNPEADLSLPIGYENHPRLCCLLSPDGLWPSDDLTGTLPVHAIGPFATIGASGPAAIHLDILIMVATLPDKQDPGNWEELQDDQHECRIFQRGCHHDGTFVRVYVPSKAADPSQPLRTIQYLHGFALCLPAFYEDHLRELAKQGWIVIFPDFQRSTYRYEPLSQSKSSKKVSLTLHSSLKWGRTIRSLLRRGREQRLLPEDLPKDLGSQLLDQTMQLGCSLPALRVKDLRRVLLPWLLIQLVLAVIGWFRRTYARNLGELIGTVLLSLAYAPEDWLRNAATLTQNAWDDLASLPEYAHWRSSPQRFYVFGHSLGGLLALSLPFLQTKGQTGHLQPQAILACDPATSTTMGIPKLALWLLRLFNSPFTSAPLDIKQVGPMLTIPVTILHGLEDTIVPPQLWAVQGGKGGFDAIASSTKALYFASSNRMLDPDLIAFHNQAVTSTQTYDDALFKSFGGAKIRPNAYNTNWIWPSLTALFTEAALPNNLLQHLGPRPFEVSTEPPRRRRRLWVWLLVIAEIVAIAASQYAQPGL